MTIKTKVKVVENKKVEDKKIEHCCEKMDSSLKKEKATIFYNIIYREYFISLKSPRNAKHPVYNCPWCGFEFPKSLVEVYHDILLKDFDVFRNSYTGGYLQGFVDAEDFHDERDFELPDEFKNDKWWKNRGL